jgi:HlyD family secretion protein
MQSATLVQEPKERSSNRLGKRIKNRISLMFKKHRKKKIATLILIVAVLAVLQVLNSQERGIPVSTAEVSKTLFEQNVFATGKLEVKDKKEFYADSNTIVTDILVDVGEKVSKGQVVLRTDDSNLAIENARNKLACAELKAKLISGESNLRLYQQNYDLARQEYENAEALFASGAISLKEREEAAKKLNEIEEKLMVERDANIPLYKEQLAQAELVYSESQKKLQKATVVSPIDGVILSLPVTKGQEVGIGTLLVLIGNPDNLQIETGINEVDAALLAVGDKVEISNRALLSQPLLGTVDYISPMAEIVTTSQGEQSQVKIRISVDDADQETEQLKPGYNVSLKIIVNQKEEAMVIPLEALVENEDKNLVYVVGQENLVEKREVETGLSNELFVEILSGLEVGEQVVLSPDELIKDGVKVVTDAASD